MSVAAKHRPDRCVFFFNFPFSIVKKKKKKNTLPSSTMAAKVLTGFFVVGYSIGSTVQTHVTAVDQSVEKATTRCGLDNTMPKILKLRVMCYSRK